jgi:hypothetical protein
MDCRDATLEEGIIRFRGITFGGPSKAVILLGAAIREHAKVIVAVQPAAVLEQARVTLGENHCWGQLAIQLHSATYTPPPLVIPELHLYDGGSFELTRPSDEGDDVKLPVVRALGWTTHAGAAVEVSVPVVKAGSFEGKDWKGDELRPMHPFYGGRMHVMGTAARA